MGISFHLAMTSAEISASAELPEKIAYMACHFSPYGIGLSNLPDSLPPGSMLILNDRTPIFGHDPALIVQQLTDTVQTLQCESLLLDFQRPDSEETAKLCKVLTASLPCPVGVSDLYASDLDCPVFLSACPLDLPLVEYIVPWKGRELWLEAATEAACIRITESGSEVNSIPYAEPPEDSFLEEVLHCRYRAELRQDQICFQLWRSPAQLKTLLTQADALGIKRSIGLYQQLYPFHGLSRTSADS